MQFSDDCKTFHKPLSIAWIRCGNLKFTFIPRERAFTVNHRSIALPVIVAVTLGVAAVGHSADKPESPPPPAAVPNPYLFVIRDPDVHRELRLTAEQVAAIRTLTDEIDLPLWSVRGMSLEEGTRRLQQLIEQAESRMADILTPLKRERLNQIVLQMQGSRALARPDIAAALGLSEKQSATIREVIDETNKELAGLQKEASDGKRRSSADKSESKLRQEEQKKLATVLSRSQRAQWETKRGTAVDTSKIGDNVAFKAPEFQNAETWINSRPLKLADLRGQVVAVHFYAFGCINCIHNYPHYKEWQSDLTKKGLAIVGIHTPETSAERDAEAVRRKADENGFEFPILVDNDKSNWTTWGNTMWPSVYLIDKKGYVRFSDWWYGEMDWQGVGGHKLMRKRIEELLAEK